MKIEKFESCLSEIIGNNVGGVGFGVKEGYGI